MVRAAKSPRAKPPARERARGAVRPRSRSEAFETFARDLLTFAGHFERSSTKRVATGGIGKKTTQRIAPFLRRSDEEYASFLGIFLIDRRVLFEGEDIVTTRRLLELRQRIGMVFQRPSPFPMSIRDNVAFAPRLLGWGSARVNEAVARSLQAAALWDEVKDRLGDSATSLSGGQLQRLSIARCLAVNPEVILMDEPCSALDPIATLKIEDLMVELARDYTIVIVTHNMQQAARVSDNTAFMLMNQAERCGELIEFAPTHELFNQPRDRRTEDYITGRFG